MYSLKFWGLFYDIYTPWSWSRFANISFGTVKETDTTPRLGNHYCLSNDKTMATICALFSVYCVRIGADAKTVFKCGASHNNHGRHIQVDSENNTTVRCVLTAIDSSIWIAVDLVCFVYTCRRLIGLYVIAVPINSAMLASSCPSSSTPSRALG